jgi:hypothetical protein
VSNFLSCFINSKSSDICLPRFTVITRGLIDVDIKSARGHSYNYQMDIEFILNHGPGTWHDHNSGGQSDSSSSPPTTSRDYESMSEITPSPILPPRLPLAVTTMKNASAVKHTNVAYPEWEVHFIRYHKDDLHHAWEFVKDALNEFQTKMKELAVELGSSPVKTSGIYRARPSSVNSRAYRDNLVPRRNWKGEFIRLWDFNKVNEYGHRRGGWRYVMRKLNVRDRDDTNQEFLRNYFSFITQCPDSAASDAFEYSWVREEHKTEARAIGEFPHDLKRQAGVGG